MNNGPEDPLERWEKHRQTSRPELPADFSQRLMQQIKPPPRQAGAKLMGLWLGRMALVAGILLIAALRVHAALYLFLHQPI